MPRRSVEGLPEWWIDDLHITRANSFDELGRQWVVGKQPDGEKGWSSSPAPRTNRTERPSSHGTYRAAAWRKERIVTLAGTVWCPSAAVREQTEATLAALCSDPGQLYEYRRRTDTFDQTISVELNDEPLIEMVTLTRVDWSFQFAAPDPRKHSRGWQSPVIYPPVPAAGGLDYSAPGLVFDLDYGPAVDVGEARVANYGTAPAYPLFTLTGSLPTPTIHHVETGRTISYHDEIAAGEVVTINCDEFPQRGFLGHSRVSTVRGNVAAVCTIATEWPVVNPQTVATFRLLSGGVKPAGLTVSLRSASW